MFYVFKDPGSATSTDWVYATQNISLSYTFEFRNKGKGVVLSSNLSLC